jgi:hypothetical protein
MLHLDNGFDLRPAGPDDAAKIALWMAQPHIQRWWQQDWPVERWVQELSTQRAGEHSIPCVAAVDAEDFGYVELYRVRHDRLAEYYASDEHDWGVHVAIGDVTRVGCGHSPTHCWRAIRTAAGSWPSPTSTTRSPSVHSPRPASSAKGSYSSPRRQHY